MDAVARRRWTARRLSELIGRDDELREIPGRGKKLSGDQTFLGLGDPQ
jgi:hypothetical protein